MIHLFFSLLFLVHPIYISSTNVLINHDKLEVKVKLFRDDLEDGLRDFHGFSISIDSSNKIEKNIDLINKYINDKLILIIDDDKIVLSANDFSLINDVLELSFLKNYFGRFIIKQAGHWVQQEQPNKTFELIIKFFKKL